MSTANLHSEEALKSRRPLVLRSFVGSLVVSLLVMYQVQIKSMWNELPAATEGDLPASQARLAAVTEFIDEHPLWIGSYMESGEKSRLSSRVIQMQTAKTLEDAKAGNDLVNRRLEAESARERAGGFVMQNEYESARDSLLHALEVAPDDWVESEQVRKDLKAIDHELEVNG